MEEERENSGARPAILGGEPVRREPIFYGHQSIDEADIAAVERVLRGDYVTCGPAVAQAEEDLAGFVGAKRAVLAANGTAALHIACLAIGIRPGDEVITTPLTFAASANCVRYCGGTVVFADIDPDTYQIDPEDIERKVTERTKAVIAVDFAGVSIDHRRIREICDRHGLRFIEDAAHAIGTEDGGRRVGSIADLTCFSFHPVKTVTCGEGGAVCTDDEELYRNLMQYRAHGITRDGELFEHSGEGAWYYEMQDLGYNYRLTDFQSAMLSSQLKKLPEFSRRRRQIVEFYDREFADVPGVILQKEPEGSLATRHLYVLQLDPEVLHCSRREFFDALAAEGVRPQVHYIPVYYFPYYEKLGYHRGLCPNVEQLYERILSIPLYPAMTDQDCADVVAAVKKLLYWFSKA